MRICQIFFTLWAFVFLSLICGQVQGQPTTARAFNYAGSITIKSSTTTVKAGERITFTGRTKGIPIGTKLVLQHRTGNKWITLQASTMVKQGSSYSLDAKLNDIGRQELRIKYDEILSPTVVVIVK